MPKYIPKKEVFRLFPYAFYEQLDQQLVDLVSTNIAFLTRDTKYEKKVSKNPKAQFDKHRNKTYGQILERNNLHTFPQGTFLVLDTFVKREDNEKAIKGRPVPRQMLLAQRIAADGTPVFHKDTPTSDVTDLNPAQLSDERLILAFMETVKDNATKEVSNVLHVIQAPEDWLETIEGPWQWLADESDQAID